MNKDYEYLFKVILVGDSGVGKSCIMTRFTDDTYDNSHISTIGVDFKIRTLEVNDKVVKLQIWDTAGQDRFRTITSSYYRGSHGIFIAFDITNFESFENAELWLKEVKNYAKEDAVIYLIGNKIDMEENRVVLYKTAHEFAKSNGLIYMETSAKNPTINNNDKHRKEYGPEMNNVEAAFAEMTTKLIKNTSPSFAANKLNNNVLNKKTVTIATNKSCCN